MESHGHVKVLTRYRKWFQHGICILIEIAIRLTDTAGIWIQLSCLWLVQSLTRDGQLSHKEGHSGLSFPSPCGEQHNSVSHNGEDKQDPQGYQLFRLKETV